MFLNGHIESWSEKVVVAKGEQWFYSASFGRGTNYTWEEYFFYALFTTNSIFIKKIIAPTGLLEILETSGPSINDPNYVYF